MSFLIRTGIIIVFLSLNTAVYAQVGNCNFIQNTDRKNYCFATTTNQVRYCYLISDSDTKNFCLAQLQNRRSTCNLIHSNDLRNECLVIVR